MSLAFQAFSENSFHKAEKALARQSRFSDGRDRRQFEWHYLRNRLGNMAGDPIGKHPFSVCGIQWIPGTSRFASVAWDGVRIWDGESKRQLFFLKADRHDALAVFPDGKTLVSAGGGTTNLIIWDLLTHEPKVALQLPEPLVRSVACSPTTNEVAVLTLGGSLVRIHAGSGAFLEILPPPESWKGEPTLPGDLSYTPDGRAVLLGGGKDAKVRRYQLNQGKNPVDLKIGFSVQNLAISADLRFLAVGGWSGQAGVWDLASGSRLFSGNHQNWVSQVRFIRQGNVLVSAGADQALRWWDWKNQRLLGEHLGRVEIWALAVAPDEKQAIVGGKDGSLWVWSLEHGTPKDYGSLATSVFDAPHYNNQQLASAPGSPMVSYATMSGTIRLSGGEGAGGAKEIVPDQAVACVAAFPRSRRLALGTLKGTVEVWSTESLDRVYAFGNGTGIVSALRVQQDERLIHAACRGGRIWSWRVEESGAEKASEWLAEGTKDPYQFSPDGTLLAGVDSENRIVMWDVQRQRAVVRLEGHAASVSALQFTPDSHRLVSASEDQVARIWRVRDWSKEGELLGSPVHGLAISPDGKRVAMASAGKQPVFLWDIDTREQVGFLPGPGAMLKNLVFSGDGQKLFAVANIDRVIVWSAPTTRP